MRQFVCPACGAANRAPDGKDPRAAKCGRCGVALFSAHPLEVDARALLAHRASTRGAAVLVDVWAPWCGPCRTMAPNFAAAAHALEPDVRLLKLKSKEKADASCRGDSLLEMPRTSLESQMASLRTKGFLRPYKPYTPPPDLHVRENFCVPKIQTWSWNWNFFVFAPHPGQDTIQPLNQSFKKIFSYKMFTNF